VLHVRVLVSRPSQSSTLHGKCWAARTATEAIITSSTLVIGCQHILRVLHHHNELGDAIHLHVILGHINAEGNHVKSMQTPAVGVREGDDVECCELRIEGICIFDVVVPHLVNNIMEELGNAMICCLVTGVVVKAGFMGSLRTNGDDHRGIVSDHLVVEWKPGWAYELGIAVVEFVVSSLGEDGHEGVYPIELILGDGFLDHKKVIIGRLPFKGGKESWASLKWQVIVLGIIVVWFIVN
jgi:hypothetical protein